MRTTRRDLLRIGALAAASAALPAWATAPVPRTTRPLRILILGGTGFTGPFQVQYALARGHQVTLFQALALARLPARAASAAYPR